MSLVQVGTQSGYPLYQDTSDGSFYIWTGDEYEYTNGTMDNPNTPQLPPISGGGVSTGGVLIQSGHSWYEDLLNTVLGLGAIGNKTGYIPSTAIPSQPYQQQYPSGYNQQQYYASQQNVGGQFGSSIQSFITKNTGLLLVGGLAFVLWKSGRK